MQIKKSAIQEYFKITELYQNPTLLKAKTTQGEKQVTVDAGEGFPCNSIKLASLANRKCRREVDSNTFSVVKPSIHLIHSPAPTKTFLQHIRVCSL
jgi:hypothetical protein